MFDKHRAKVAAEAYAKALSEWQVQRDGMAELIQTAETFAGAPSNDVMLRNGEKLFLAVSCQVV
ncbi:MAG: hypothetical protein ACLQT7_07760 [Candidatus Dormibacteria bacterium]